MKVKGLKQVLHWLFLLVGVFSVIALALSVSAYLDYASGGYGLEVSVSGARLDSDNRTLLMSVTIRNPGGLDVQMLGGNVTLVSAYEILYYPYVPPADGSYAHVYLADGNKNLSAGKESTFHLSIQLTDADLEEIGAAGSADITLNLEIYVPDRGLVTVLVHKANGLEVGP